MAIVDTIHLSPWPTPTATATRAQAVARLREALGKAANDMAWPEFHVTMPADSVPDKIDYALHRLAGTVSGRVESYAPSAPQSAKDEAVIRGVGYLDDLPGALRLQRIPGVSFRLPDSAQSWFRHSGAMACLAPYRSRSAGIVEDTE